MEGTSLAAHPFFSEFLIVLIVATAVAVIAERLRLSSVLGFLLAGVVIGPDGLGLLSDPDRIHRLAELGIVLLMLTIGLEFSFERLKGVRNVAMIGGALQLLGSIAIGILFALWQGWTLYQGFFLGSVVALSSTAIVLKHLLDRGELDTEYGKVAVAILIFQDLAVVPLLILVTSLGGPLESVVTTLSFNLFKAVLFLGAMLFFARFVIPELLHRVALSRNREIFFLTMVILCLGAAWISGQLGLSLAISAFLVGLMFASTDYGHDLIGQTAPFRYIFVSLFFVSLGLLFDVHFAMEHFLLIIAVIGLVLLINCAVMTGLILGFGYPPRIAFVAGLILAQIGEFSFLLLEAGRTTGAIDPFFYQLLLSAAFLTMLLTPALFALIPGVLQVSGQIASFGISPTERRDPGLKRLKGHVILCGFGPTGSDLALTLEGEKYPFLIVEINPRAIKEAKHFGFPVLYGDAANEELLRRAQVVSARAVVVSFSDPIGMAQIVRMAERLNPDALLVVRTRFERDVPRLYELGADVVVMEEVESSLEMNRLLLKALEVPEDRIEGNLKRIRTRKELVIEQKILEDNWPEKQVE